MNVLVCIEPVAETLAIARERVRHSKCVLADLAATIERSRDRLWFGAEQRLGRTGRLRFIRGGSDLGLITAAIAAATVCLDCIARRTGIPPARVTDMLGAIGKTLKLGSGRTDAPSAWRTRPRSASPRTGSQSTASQPTR